MILKLYEQKATGIYYTGTTRSLRHPGFGTLFSFCSWSLALSFVPQRLLERSCHNSNLDGCGLLFVSGLQHGSTPGGSSTGLLYHPCQDPGTSLRGGVCPA